MKNYQFNRAKIKALMAEHGHNQKDLADILGLSQQWIVRKLDGRAQMTVEELLTIANHYGENPTIFFRECAN